MKYIYSFSLFFLAIVPFWGHAQNVGIGESAPTAKLDVKGDPGNDLLNIRNSSGTSQLYVNSSGEVGIGTATPAGHQLIINSSQGSAGSSAIRAIYSSGGGLAGTEFGALAHRGGQWAAVYAAGGTGGALALHTDGDILLENLVSTGTANSRILTVDASGNVSYQDAGLWASGGGDNLGNHTATQNINASDYQLQNVRAIQGIDWDDNTGGTNNKYRLLYRDGAHMFYNGGVVVGNYSNGTWSDVSDGQLIVENSMGIGVTNPAETLHVNGSVRGNQSGALRISTGSGYVDIGPKNASWSHFYTDRDRYYFSKPVVVDDGEISSYNEDLYLRGDYDNANTANQLVLKTNGYVGIGTSSPVTRLHSVNDTDVPAVGGELTTSASSFAALEGYNPNTSGGGGVLGIGYNGVQGEWTNTAGWAGTFIGDVRAYYYYNISDERFKTNIRQTPNTLGKVMKLEVMNYEMNADEFPGMKFKDEQTEFGFIAQELEQVFPELVKTAKFNNMKSALGEDNDRSDEEFKLVSYVSMIPILTKALQEQQALIEQQQNEINELKAETKALKKEIRD